MCGVHQVHEKGQSLAVASVKNCDSVDIFTHCQNITESLRNNQNKQNVPVKSSIQHMT